MSVSGSDANYCCCFRSMLGLVMLTLLQFQEYARISEVNFAAVLGVCLG